MLVRTGWCNGRWLSAHGIVFALIPALRKVLGGVCDYPRVGRSQERAASGAALVALKLSEQAAAEARRKARRQARKEGYQVSQETLQAKVWMILITALPAETYTSDDSLTLQFGQP